MSAWTTEQIAAIEADDDLLVAPFCEDGTTYGTDTQTWALVVDGNVYVRPAKRTRSPPMPPTRPSTRADSAVRIMQGAGPNAPSVLIAPI